MNKTFTLRINEQVFNRVKTQALKNKRSIAKEIEYVLEQYLKKEN